MRASLGIGTIGDKYGVDVITRQMNRLLDAGCCLVDTAACYGDSELIIGQHLSHRRDEMILVSKCGHHDVLADGRLRSRPISLADIDQSLSRLQTEYLDAMLLHSYDYDLLVQGDALAVLERAREQGKIRFIGYSGDNERAVWAAACPLIEVLELSINLVDQYNIRAVLPLALKRELGVIAKRPLANAAWRHAAKPMQADPHHRTYTQRFAHMGIDHHQFHCASMAELALRFTISQPGVSCAIASSARDEHVAANLEAAGKGPLAKADIIELEQAFQSCETASGGTWLACN